MPHAFFARFHEILFLLLARHTFLRVVVGNLLLPDSTVIIGGTPVNACLNPTLESEKHILFVCFPGAKALLKGLCLLNLGFFLWAMNIFQVWFFFQILKENNFNFSGLLLTFFS